MKKVMLIFALLVAAFHQGRAQVDSLLLADSLQLTISPSRLTGLQWVDLDQNKQLDLLAVGEQDTSDGFRLLRFVPDTDTILVDTTAITLLSDQVLYRNVDHRFGLDILNFEANELVIYFHEGDSNYVRQEWTFDDLIIQALDVTDFNQDGEQELVVNGRYQNEATLAILRRSGEEWAIEPIALEVDQFALVRTEEVSPPSLWVFGSDTLYQYSEADTQALQRDTAVAFEGSVNAFSIGYIDDNDKPDIAFVRENESETGTYLLMNSDTVLLLDSVAYGKLLVADFNSDGTADVYAENDTLKTVYLNNGTSLDRTGFDRQDLDGLTASMVSYGDFDFDGDLDVAAYEIKITITHHTGC